MFSRLLTSAATPPAVLLDLRSAAIPYVRERGAVPARPSLDAADLPDMTVGLSRLDRPHLLEFYPQYPLLTRVLSIPLGSIRGGSEGNESAMQP